MNTESSRRDFLRQSMAALPLLMGSQALWDASFRPTASKGKTLIAIYLRGGADALNMIIPYADKRYAVLRPGIGIPTEGAVGQKVITLDERFGLHPALKGLMPLYQAGLMLPIVNAGSPHPTRSHFDAQDFMEYAAPGDRSLKSGWLNRYLDLPRAAKPTIKNKADSKRPALRALAAKKTLPRALRGSYPALAFDGAPRKKVDEVLDLFDPLYGGGETMEEMGEKDRPRDEGEGAVRVGRETISTLRRLHEILEDPNAKTRAGVVYPRGTFGNGMERIARVIKADAGLETACIDLTGWDTHTNQGGAQGSMARRLAMLGDGIAALSRDLGPRFKDVCVVVMTEFGRTCHENGNRGTDHGHGSAMFLAGGGVSGGKVHGDWKGLDVKKLYQGRDLPVTTDYREVFRSCLEGFLETSLPKEFFPGYVRAKKRLPLFR